MASPKNFCIFLTHLEASKFNTPFTFFSSILISFDPITNKWVVHFVIVGIEGYNKVVEEVVKRLAENNWYVKLEKCKWKIRKVGFSEVVISKS